MKYSKINQIFWGLIIIFIDINIQNFDILPDFIGLIIAVTALPALYEHSERFGAAFKAGIVSLALDVLSYAFGLFSPQDVSPLTIVFFIAGTIINLVFMYCLMYGLSDMAERHEVPLTAEKLRRGYLFIVIIAVLGSLAFFMVLVEMGFAIVFIIVCFVMYIYVLYTIRHAYNTIHMEQRILP